MFVRSSDAIMTNTSGLPDIRQQLGDRYAIERELGRGGMGAVYLARDLRLDRPVALKVLPAEFAGDSLLRERFLRETRTAASFSHPNIVPVHAVEERDGVLAFAMGFVEGESVAERVRRAGPLDVRSVVRLLQDIGYALAYAHGRGVVHRDIKPDNIMLERATGRALLMDFGISRSITAKVEGKGATRGLTRVGEVVGTAEYMSPEQASGDVVDGRSDLYSLGLVALFALTGRPAITGESTQQILIKQLTETPPPAVSLRPDLPESLGAAIDRCVAKEPSARFATAEALVEAIDEARLAAPEIPVPIRLFAQELGTLSLVVVFMTMIAWLLYQNAEPQDRRGVGGRPRCVSRRDRSDASAAGVLIGAAAGPARLPAGRGAEGASRDGGRARGAAPAAQGGSRHAAPAAEDGDHGLDPAADRDPAHQPVVERPVLVGDEGGGRPDRVARADASDVRQPDDGRVGARACSASASCCSPGAPFGCPRASVCFASSGLGHRVAGS